MASPAPDKPDYVKFLMSEEIQHHLGFHVNVGDPQIKKERIGCLRWMLIAQSKTLRTMLFESELKEGSEMSITDMSPDTFKDFLIFAYGHDHTESLEFVRAIELLGAAEKYDVADLKTKLDSVITPRVSVENVCTVLRHGPVCDTAPQLWRKTTTIIQTRTAEVFAHPEFLTLNTAAVVHILQQDALSVVEIEVWRAALNWARFQVEAEGVAPSPELVRRTMDPLLRHTRLCWMPQVDIVNEVVPANILTKDDLMKMLASVASTKRQLSTLETAIELFENPGALTDLTVAQSGFDVLTNTSRVELDSVVVKANAHPGRSNYLCEGTLFVSKQIGNDYNILHVTDFSEIVVDDSEVELKFRAQGGAKVVLDVNAKYVLGVQFRVPHRLYGCDSRPNCNNADFHVKICCFKSGPHTLYGNHFKCFKFRVLG